MVNAASSSFSSMIAGICGITNKYCVGYAYEWRGFVGVRSDSDMTRCIDCCSTDEHSVEKAT